jgi:serine/threonine protein kinase
MNGLLSGFAYAHSQNIVHRDVKPNNVIISRDFNTVKILDFGIAKIINDNSKNLTKDGTQMGTVYYMSPEQVRGQKIDNRSDIYSLGVTLFQIVTGINPYEKITTEYEIYSKITQEELQDAKSVYPYISDKIEAVIKKATRKNPADRYQNCEQMLADLNSVKTIKTPKPPVVPIQKPVQQPIQNPIQQKPVQQQAIQKPIQQQEPIPQKKENNNLVFGLIGGLLVVCIIVGFITKCQPIKPDPIPDPPIEKKIDTLKNNISGDVFIYDGDKNDGKADGKGTAYYIDSASNGETYTGDFINNSKDGKGIYKWPNGSYYDGEFRNNKRNGCGTYFDISTGEKTYGEFQNDEYIGSGNCK